VGQFESWNPPGPDCLTAQADVEWGYEQAKETQRDTQELARSILDQVAPDAEPAGPIEEMKPEKNPAAVALGRLGGLKGGKARAAKLTAEERAAIARKAAKRRWGRPS
jgi:hypothetical protein